MIAGRYVEPPGDFAQTTQPEMLTATLPNMHQREFFFTLLLLTSCSVFPQTPLKLPSWMTKPIGAERVKKATFYGSDTHHAEWVEKKRRSHVFIGAYKMEMAILDSLGKETIGGTVDGWQDSTRAIITFRIESAGMYTYMADLQADVAVVAYSVPDIAEHLYAERISQLVSGEGVGMFEQALYMEHFADSATGKTMILLGRKCEERVFRNIRSGSYWVDASLPSPFAGMGRWLPLHETPFTVFAPLSLHGNSMPMKWEKENIVFRMTSVAAGTQPRPPVDLTKYPIQEEDPAPAAQEGAIQNEIAEMDISDVSAPPPPDAEVEVFTIVEEMPQFPGGEEKLKAFLRSNVSYPQMEKEAGVQGKVYVAFVVEADGSITRVELRRGISPGLDREALRVVKSMPKWTPGKQNGKTVRVQYTVAVAFALQ